jgi:hypothetical protein
LKTLGYGGFGGGVLVGSFEKGGGVAKDKWWTQVMLRKLIIFFLGYGFEMCA